MDYDGPDGQRSDLPGAAAVGSDQDTGSARAGEPLLATKRCRLGLVDSSPALRPAVRGTFVRASSRARCGEGHVHRAPEPGCTCGFYALADTDELRARLGPWHPEEVELDVELAGRVVRHERGLRGEQQTVLGVRLHRMCALCPTRNPRPTSVVGRVRPGRQRADWDGLLPLCDRCAVRAAELWTVAGLAATLGTEVTVDRDSPHAAPSRRLTARGRVRLAAAATLAVCYLALGLVVAVRGVGVGASAADADQLATARSAADAIITALVPATDPDAAEGADPADRAERDIEAGSDGTERDREAGTDTAEVEAAVRDVLDDVYGTGVRPDVDVAVDDGVDVAVVVDGLCMLVTASPTWQARAVREGGGGCDVATARTLRPVVATAR